MRKNSKMLFCECKNQEAKSAAYLLNKYAKNSFSDQKTEVDFITDTSQSGDNYRITVDGEKITVFANTAVGFNAAVGYILRHQHTHIENVEISFESDFRAVYFASHFFNYYHVAPVEEICEYMETLALWGQSAFSMWFDMHQFRSIDSPDAKEMINRIVTIFKKAKSLGMKVFLGRLPNEYYENDFEDIKAENDISDGRYWRKLCGFFGMELCPSKPEGEEKLNTSFEELLEAFSEVGLDLITFWPYDQGGCTCKDCYPWGSNGFYRLAKKQAAMAKEVFPDIKIIFACWRFDCFTNGEWDSIIPIIKSDGDWIDYLMIDIDGPIPEEIKNIGKKIVSYPEISMYEANPWGGFGVNPFPKALYAQFQKIKEFCKGGAMYSEGIFEDINKVIVLELMRDSSLNPEQIVLEYCTYHFGEKYAKELADIIIRLEKTLPRQTYLSNGERNDYPSGTPDGLHTYVIANADLVKEIADDLAAIDCLLPQEIKENVRYRMLYIRVFGDLALIKNGGIPSEESDEIFSGLTKIYYAENAYYCVSPVTREAVLKNRPDGVKPV